MDTNGFRIIVAVLLIGFMVHRGLYIRKVQQKADSVIKQPSLGWVDRVANLLALPAFLSTALYIFVPGWMSWSALALPLWLRWVGVTVALAGFVLLQWSQQTLGRNWSDAPKLFKGQELILNGPYHWVRHPIYTAFLLILGSLLLITSNWFIGVAWLGMTGLNVAARINVEEAMLLGQFGEQYQTYRQATGRLFPRLLG